MTIFQEFCASEFQWFFVVLIQKRTIVNFCWRFFDLAFMKASRVEEFMRFCVFMLVILDPWRYDHVFT